MLANSIIIVVALLLQSLAFFRLLILTCDDESYEYQRCPQGSTWATPLFLKAIAYTLLLALSLSIEFWEP